jgi:hypothetical protein
MYTSFTVSKYEDRDRQVESNKSIFDHDLELQVPLNVSKQCCLLVVECVPFT